MQATSSDPVIVEVPPVLSHREARDLPDRLGVLSLADLGGYLEDIFAFLDQGYSVAGDGFARRQRASAGGRLPRLPGSHHEVDVVLSWIGRWLYQLLPLDAQDCLDAIVSGGAEQVRLVVLETSEHESLPWEYVYHAILGFVVLHPQVSLVYMDVNDRDRVGHLGKRPLFRILPIAVQPCSDQKYVFTKVELARDLYRGVVGHVPRELRANVVVRPHETDGEQLDLDDLRSALVHARPTICHVGAHGVPFSSELLLSGPNGVPKPASGASLGATLASAFQLQLVTLIVCGAGALGERKGGIGRLVAEVRDSCAAPCILASRYTLTSVTANIFCAAFYQELVSGASIESCVRSGRRALHAAGLHSFGHMSLYTDSHAAAAIGFRRPYDFRRLRRMIRGLGWIGLTFLVLFSCLRQIRAWNNSEASALILAARDFGAAGSPSSGTALVRAAAGLAHLESFRDEYGIDIKSLLHRRTTPSAGSRTLRGHTGAVRALAFSADGAFLVSGGEDGTARTWRTTDGVCLEVLDHDGMAVTAVAVDGDELISHSADGLVRTWNVYSGARLWKQEIQSLSLDSLGASIDVLGTRIDDDGVKYARAFRTDLKDDMMDVMSGGRWAAAGGKGLAVWDLSMAIEPEVWRPIDPVRRLELVTTDVSTPIFHARAGAVLYDRIKGWVNEKPMKNDSAFLTAVDISADGTLVAAGSGDGRIAVWDIRNGHQVAVWQAHNDNVSMIRFSPNARTIASVGGDSAERTLVLVWSVNADGAVTPLDFYGPDKGGFGPFEPGDLHYRALAGHSASVSAIQFLDTTHLVSGSADGSVQVWDTRSGDTAWTLLGHGEVTQLFIWQDLIAVGTEGGDVHLWKVNRESARPLTSSRMGVGSPTVSPTGKWLAEHTVYGNLHVWKTDEGMPWFVPTTEHVRGDSMTSGNQLLVLTSSKLDRWSLSTRSLLASTNLPSDLLWDTEQFSPNGELVALAQPAGVVVLNSNTPTVRLDLRAEHDISALEFSSDGRFIAGFEAIRQHAQFDNLELGGNVTIWELTSGTACTVKGPAGGVSHVSFALASPLVCVAFRDESLSCLDMDTCTTDLGIAPSGDIRDLNGSREGFVAVLTSPASGTWALDVLSGRTVRLSDAPNGLVGFDISPNGDFVVATDAEYETGDLFIWDLRSGGLLLRLVGQFEMADFLSEDTVVVGWAESWATVAVPMRADIEEDLATTGDLTNVRVCRNSFRPVAVNPWPSASTVWADPEWCP